LAILLVHHKASSWTCTNLRKLKVKLGISAAGQACAETLAERSYDAVTLCLVKGEFAEGDIVVSPHGGTYNQSHYVFTSASRKPSVVLTLARALPVPHSRQADIMVTPETGDRYQEPEAFIPLPTTTSSADHHSVGSGEPSRQAVAEPEEMEEGHFRALGNDRSQEMGLAEGQVTAVAMEFCVKQIALGGKDVIQ